jgi:NAD(P)H-dependent flavin oxidoreductase YrpB (nitropropane dioxygenase family)
MLETRFTKLVGCSVPIEVAPMGAISTPELLAAANEAGALGMMGVAGLSADQVPAAIDAIENTVRGPVGVNMLIPFLDEAVIEAVAPRVRVFDLYHGDPSARIVDIVHTAGALASWQVGSLEEAKAAADAGCDLIAVRGIEGGGRMHGREPLWPLLGRVLDAVDVPVLAAGGLATGRDLAAVLAFGADGARMGTRFVATDESGAHPVYKQALVDAKADETALVTDFSVMWPEGPRPHRVLRRALEAANAVSGESVGEMLMFGERRAVPKFAVVPPVADSTGNIDAFAMYAGMSVGSIDSIEPAGKIIRDIVSGAEELLAKW